MMLPSKALVFLSLTTLLLGTCFSQSNSYHRRLGYQPRRTTPTHRSPKARISLVCGGEDITVKLDFMSPFNGLVYAGSVEGPCRLRGDGRYSYSLRVPLNGCGTKHICPSGTFTNRLFIRYHPSLERDGDEINAIQCQYGPRSVLVS